jgi:sulfate adenylyltransferase
MPKPHGGRLITRQIKKESYDTKDFIELKINTNLSEDVLNISHGVFSPLEGFLCNNDLQNVISEKRLVNDTPWTIPILLDFDKSKLNEIKEGDSILLTNKEYGLRSIISIDEIYTYDKKRLSQEIYRTQDMNHPGVANVNNMKEHLFGGKITLLESKPREYDEYNLTPKETRFLFKEKKMERYSCLSNKKSSAYRS